MKSTEPLNVDLEPSIRFSVSWPSVFACISLRTYNKQETRGQMATGPKCLHKCLGRTANRSFSVFQTHSFFLLAFGFAAVCSISAPHWRGKWFPNRTPCIHSENVGAVNRPGSEQNKINRNQPRATQTRRATQRRATRQTASAAVIDFVVFSLRVSLALAHIYI